MEETTREIGGNQIKLLLGNKLAKWGEKLITKGSKLVISNPTCKLHSPYLLVVNFTVNNTEKYTLTLQGDYKEKYKEISNSLKDKDVDSVEDVQDPITINEMFILILEHENIKKWFLKIWGYAKENNKGYVKRIYN